MTSEKLFATTIVALMLLTVSIAGGRRATKAVAEGGSGADTRATQAGAPHQPASPEALPENPPQASQESTQGSREALIQPSRSEKAPHELLTQSSPSVRPSPFRGPRSSGAETAVTAPADQPVHPARHSAFAAGQSSKHPAPQKQTPPSILRAEGEPKLAAQLRDPQLSSFSDDSAAGDFHRIGIARIGGNIGRMARLGGNLGRRATIGGNIGRMAEVVGAGGAVAMLGGNVGRVAVLGGDLGAKATMGGDRGTPATVHQGLG